MRTLLGIHKPLIGVVHLLPLPGSPGYGGSMQRVLSRAVSDARAYLESGMDALLVENFGDLPFYASAVAPETVAALTLAATRLRDMGSFPMGINVLRSDGPAAMAIAAVVGAQFVRVNVLSGAMVTDQGVIQGCAARIMRLRTSLKARVRVWGDLLVKHATPLGSGDILEAARDLTERAQADALIVTGPRTGTPVAEERLKALRRAMPRSPMVVGSGVNPENLEPLWNLADGFIVGTSLKKGARTRAVVDPALVERLIGVRGRLARGRKRSA